MISVWFAALAIARPVGDGSEELFDETVGQHEM
jgi:hypothetical protein